MTFVVVPTGGTQHMTDSVLTKCFVIFIGKGSEMSCIFESITFFLHKMASEDIDGLARLFPSSGAVIFTPWERDEFNRYIFTLSFFIIPFYFQRQNSWLTCYDECNTIFTRDYIYIFFHFVWFHLKVFKYLKRLSSPCGWNKRFSYPFFLKLTNKMAS